MREGKEPEVCNIKKIQSENMLKISLKEYKVSGICPMPTYSGPDAEKPSGTQAEE